LINQAHSAFSALKQKEHELKAAVDWQPLACGSSNWLFKGHLGGCDYVLRINASTEYAFGVCRAREEKVLALIQGQDWAVEIIENNVTKGWCLMKDHGASLTLKDVSPSEVLQMLAQIHQFSQSVTPHIKAALVFDYQKLFSQYQTILTKENGNELAIALCRQLSDSIKHLPAVPSVLMHQDLHLKNVCLQDSLIAIDWEYGGWGSPWLDSAALCREFEVSATLVRQLSVFDQLSDDAFIAGLDLAGLINKGISCIWYWMRRQKGVAKMSCSEHKLDLSQVSLEQLTKDTQLCLDKLSKVNVVE